MTNKEPETRLPSNVDAERSILGAILLSNGNLFSAAAGVLQPDDFFLDSHRRIFLRMGQLDVEHIDLVTLCEMLMQNGEVEAVGGSAYLSSLTDGMPRHENIDHYIEIVKEKKRLRDLVYTGANLSQTALDSNAQNTGEQIAAEFQRQLSGLVQNSRRGYIGMEQLFQQEFQSVDSFVANHAASAGIKTGYACYDALTLGLHPGELIILAARPSIGKTSLALNIAAHFAGQQKHVAIASLEMTRQAVLMRMIFSEARVPYMKWAGGYLNHAESFAMISAASRIREWPVFIDDDSSLRPEMILARARRLAAMQGRLDLLIVDYLQLMNAGKFESRTQEVSYISRCMKDMAKELSCPVIAISQLNRAPEDRIGGKPRLSDLRESGQLEQDADTVLFLWKQAGRKTHPSRVSELDPDERGIIHASIEKQRNGPTGEFELIFLDKYCRFENKADAWAQEDEAAQPNGGGHDELF